MAKAERQTVSLCYADRATWALPHIYRYHFAYTKGPWSGLGSVRVMLLLARWILSHSSPCLAAAVSTLVCRYV